MAVYLRSLPLLYKELIETFVSGCHEFDREAKAQHTVMQTIKAGASSARQLAFDPKRSRIMRGFLSIFLLNVAGGYDSVAPALQKLDSDTLKALKRVNEINLAHLKHWPVVQRLRPIAAVGTGVLLLWQQLAETKPLTWISTHILGSAQTGVATGVLSVLAGVACGWLLVRFVMDAVVVGRVVRYVGWFGEILDLAILSSTPDDATSFSGDGALPTPRNPMISDPRCTPFRARQEKP